MDALGQAMPRGEVARKLVVAAAGDDELDFILAVDRVEIGWIEGICLTRIGALDVHDFHHLARKLSDIALAAGLDQHCVTRSEKFIGQWIDVGLQQWLTAGEFRSEERRVGKECRSRWSPYH